MNVIGRMPVCLLFIALCCGQWKASAQPAPAAAAGPVSACPAAFNAGFRIVQISGTNVGIWYPTAASESPYSYNSRTNGSVALNAAVSDCARFPLIAFSHGYGGCATQSVFITEQMARNGYIFAAPDHKDAGCSVTGTTGLTPTVTADFRNPQTWTDQTFIDRRNDIEKTIDWMLSSPDFGARIDPAQIAGSGHSLGGYTIFGLVGGWDSWYDPRLKAALLFSPYMEPFLDQNRVGFEKAPVMYQGGTLDIGITPFITKSGGVYDLSPLPKLFIELRAAGHLAWTNRTCDDYSTVQQCLQSNTNAQLIDTYAEDFLNRYVEAVEQPALFNAAAGLADYRRETLAAAVSAASYQKTLAPGNIASLFSDELAAATVNATGDLLNLPRMISDLVVTITDSQGKALPARLYFVSRQQINLVVPSEAALGTATVTVTRAGNVIAGGSLNLTPVAPSLFSANQSGSGLAAALYQRVGDNPAIGPIFTGNVAPVPVDVSNGDVYLWLYGTGLRNASNSEVKATVGGFDVPVYGPVAQGQYAGFDQVNIGPLPKSLAGRGLVNIAVTAGGLAANVVQVYIK